MLLPFLAGKLNLVLLICVMLSIPIQACTHARTHAPTLYPHGEASGSHVGEPLGPSLHDLLVCNCIQCLTS